MTGRPSGVEIRQNAQSAQQISTEQIDRTQFGK